jgi:hypothetical protein
VIVDDFESFWTIGSPHEANPILPVDPNAVLAFPVSLERLKLVRRGHPERFERHGGVEVVAFAPCDRPECARTAAPGRARIDAIVQIVGAAIGKRANHGSGVQEWHTGEDNAYRYTLQALSWHRRPLLCNAPANLRANQIKCERSELPKIARQVQRTLWDAYSGWSSASVENL